VEINKVLELKHHKITLRVESTTLEGHSFLVDHQFEIRHQVDGAVKQLASKTDLDIATDDYHNKRHGSGEKAATP
jgi:hypothetical protein